MKDLKLSVHLAALDKATGPLKSVASASTALGRQLATTRETLKGLNAQQRDISAYKRQESGLRQSGESLSAAREKLRQYQTQLKGLEAPSEKFQRDFLKAKNRVDELTKSHTDQRKAIAATVSGLKAAGVDVRNLGDHENRLKSETEAATTAIEKQQDALKKLGAQQARINTLKTSMGNVREAGGRVADQARSLGTQAAVAGAAGGYLFKTQFLDRAAEFEKYRTILKTVTGSELKASEAMSWVSDFAARTPYELGEVLESFTRLKAYGIDPMADGMLKTLGDTASAMGKPVMQAVEAMADAVTGENERLKEFGIKGSKSGGMISYEYTNAAGETLTKSVDASNRKLIQSTLQAIWNEKYSGAMADQSKTWNGMISNIGDQWARFTNMAMAAGLFDRMKERLGGVLDQLDKMAANGQLQEWANKVGGGMLKFADGLWNAGTALSSITSTLANSVGGWQNFFMILAALKLAPLAVSLVSLTSSLIGAGSALVAVVGGSAAFVKAGALISGAVRGIGIALWALAANPAVIVIGGIIAALSVGAYLIWKNWATLGPKFSALFDWIKGVFVNGTAQVLGFFTAAFSQITGFFSGVFGQLKTGFSGGLGGISSLILNWSPLGLFYQSFAGVLNWFGADLPGKFTEFGGMMMRGLVSGITNALGSVKAAISGAGESVINSFKEKLGIRSPSRVFSALGIHTMDGLGQGLAIGEKAPLSALDETTRAVINRAREMSNPFGALAAGAMGGALALGAMPAMAMGEGPALAASNSIGSGKPITFDNRPPLSKQAPASYTSQDVYYITVNAAPGDDGRDLARTIREELDKRDREKLTRKRGQLSDLD